MLGSIIYLLIVVLLLVSMWKVYEKAGRQHESNRNHSRI